MSKNAIPSGENHDARLLDRCSHDFADELMRASPSPLLMIEKILTLLEEYKYQLNKFKCWGYCDHELAIFCFQTAQKLFAFIEESNEKKFTGLIMDLSSTFTSLTTGASELKQRCGMKHEPHNLESRFAKLQLYGSTPCTPASTKHRDYISSRDLNYELRSKPNQTLLVDFRSKKEFDHSRINFSNVLNIDPQSLSDSIKNCLPQDVVLEDALKKSLGGQDLQLFHNRHTFELVVIYNYKFGVFSDNRFDSLTPLLTNDTCSFIADNPFKGLINLLMCDNRSLSFRLQTYPVFLNGGIQRWYRCFGEAGIIRGSPNMRAETPSKEQDTELTGSQSSAYLKTFQDYVFSGSANRKGPRLADRVNPVVMSTDNVEPEKSSVSSRLLAPHESTFSNAATFDDFTAVPSFSTGLVNLGNSCYMNCILQCLISTPYLSSFLLSESAESGGYKAKTYKDHINLNNSLGSQGVVTVTLANLMKQMMLHKGGQFTPSKFKKVVGSLSPGKQFSTKEQQDCIEFLNFVLDSLHEDLNQRSFRNTEERIQILELSEEQESVREKLPLRLASTIEWERYLKSNFSIIVDFFQGQYVSQLKCLECCLTSSTYNAFSTLSLPIPETPDTSTRSCSLYDCLNKFVETEYLDDHNKWHCPRCKRFTKSTKKLMISRLPRILIIHFKRFDMVNGQFKKLESFVNYPVDFDLDLTRYWPPTGTYIDASSKRELSENEEINCLSALPERHQTPPFLYRLYGVANHYGNLTTGHYTSFVKKSNEWVYFDDSKVQHRCSGSKVLNSNAYCLFYRRI